MFPHIVGCVLNSLLSMGKSCVSPSRKLETNIGCSLVQSNITEKYNQNVTLLLITQWGRAHSKSPFAYRYETTVKLVFDCVWFVTSHLKFSPNFTWGLLKKSKPPTLSEGESVTVLVLERRQNYWCTKYAELWQNSCLIFSMFKLCIVYDAQFMIHIFRWWLRAR